MRTWRMVEKHCHISNIWHTLSPIFNNKALLIGGRPISAPPWEQGGVHYLKDIFNNYGLLSFSDIKNAFNLPGSSSFFHLQLRSALKAYGVPWQDRLPTHPVRRRFTLQTKTKGMVSKLYQFLVIPDRFSLPVEHDWHDVWSDISSVT